MSQLYAPLALLFVCSSLIAFVTTPVVRKAARQIGLLDEPGERKVHPHGTPRLGGLAIIFAFGFPLMLLSANEHAADLVSKNLTYLFAVLSSGSLIIALGAYDDLIGANAPKKFAVQFAAAIILVSFGFEFNAISVAGWSLNLGLFGSVVSVLWIVGVMNAMNFIDGVDSLATVVALTTAVAFTIIAVLRHDVFSLVIMIALTGALAGFYPWNRPPAKIFMGDSGALFIGLLLAAGSIARPSKSPTALLIAGPMIALALPVIDTLIVMKERFEGKDSSSLPVRLARVVTADRRHIHHILVAKYGSVRKAILAIWLVTLVFAVSAVLSVVPGTKLIGYSVGCFGVIALLVIRYRRKPAPVPAPGFLAASTRSSRSDNV
jgi:UDP-GlcNAc:undecaprenyl-phosphate GlcNAc-1-phosphate transferase